MATQTDKLSPIFKSLHPDQAPLANVTTAAVKDAEQRWPLFRAIAPVRPPAVPVLTDEERVSRAASKAAADVQRTPALSLPGLNEQLAQGLSKMAGRKSSPRTRSKAKVSARAMPVESPVVADEKPPQAAKQAVPDVPVVRLKPEPAQVSTVASAVPAPTVRKAVLSEPAAAAAQPAVAPVPVAVANVQAQPGSHTMQLKPLAPLSAAAVPVSPPVVERSAAKAPSNLPSQSVAQGSTESLKSLFSRLQAPPKVEPSVPTKKPSFLGRLARR